MNQIFEKVLVQNILFGLSPSFTKSYEQIPRWRFIVATLPHVMHCASSMLQYRWVLFYFLLTKSILVLQAHSQREKQRLLAMLFSTSKYEKSKANVKLAKAKVEVLTLLLHSHWEVEHVPLMLCFKLEKLFSKWFSAIFTADLGLNWIVLETP